MITDELDGIHQRQERVLPDHPPLFLDEGHEEDHLSLQPQLLGMVRKLPGLAHQGGQGVRRPSLPYPTPSVILKIMYCLVGISTCPWPVQLAAYPFILLPTVKAPLFVFMNKHEFCFGFHFCLSLTFSKLQTCALTRCCPGHTITILQISKLLTKRI